MICVTSNEPFTFVYRISSNEHEASNKRHPLNKRRTINTQIKINTAPLNAALFRKPDHN